MKLSRTIAVSLLMVLFLAVGLCYGQGTAEEFHAKGVKYAVQGKFEKAKQEFERALKVDPFYTQAKFNLKVIEDVIDQRIKSKTAIHLFKGDTYLNKVQWDKAIAEYNKALEICYGLNSRGLAYRLKGQHDRAISDYNRAIEINPRYAMAYFNKALACEKAGRKREAIKAYRGFIKYTPPRYGRYIKHARQRIKELGG